MTQKLVKSLYQSVCPSIFLLISPLIVHAGPSFTCSSGLSEAEQTVCENPVLWQPDKELTQNYRDFLQKLPKEQGVMSKNLQRLWIKSREIRCFGNTYQFELGGNIPADLSNTPDKNPKDCLVEYYWFANSSFERGLQTVGVFFEQNKDIYNVGIGQVDRLVITKLPGETHRSVFINTAERRNRIGGIQIDEYGHQISNEFRFYLTQSGELLIASKMINESLDYNHRCGQGINTGLWFYRYTRASGAVLFPGMYSGVNLIDASSSCSLSYSQVEQWRYEPDKGLVFVHIVVWGHMYQLLFPEKYRIIVSPHKGISYREEFDTYTADYDFSSILAVKPAGNNLLDDSSSLHIKTKSLCADIFKGINNYFVFKADAVRQKMSAIEALKYADEFLRKTEFEKIHRFRRSSKTTAETFLRYLDEIRSHNDWQLQLNKLAKAEGQTTLIDEVKGALYTGVGCMSAVRPPYGGASSLEDWVYLFWARRLRDGNLHQTETLLRMIRNVVKK